MLGVRADWLHCQRNLLGRGLTALPLPRCAGAGIAAASAEGAGPTRQGALKMATVKQPRAETWAWRCQECGRAYRSVGAARRAAYGDDGCPRCGSSDVDYSRPIRNDDRTDASDD